MKQKIGNIEYESMIELDKNGHLKMIKSGTKEWYEKVWEPLKEAYKKL